MRNFIPCAFYHNKNKIISSSIFVSQMRKQTQGGCALDQYHTETQCQSWNNCYFLLKINSIIKFGQLDQKVPNKAFMANPWLTFLKKERKFNFLRMILARILPTKEYGYFLTFKNFAWSCINTSILLRSFSLVKIFFCQGSHFGLIQWTNMFTKSHNITEWFSIKVASKEIQGPSEMGSSLCARKCVRACEVLEKVCMSSQIHGGRWQQQFLLVRGL